MKHPVLLAALVLASRAAFAGTVFIFPERPAHDDPVFVEYASYFASRTESFSVVGNAINVHFVEETWDWGPNPPMAPSLAAIGSLVPGEYTVNVRVDFGSTTTFYSYPLTVTVVPTDPVPNYQGLWWAAGGVESGWGLSIAHQGDLIYAVWFTYDLGGRGLWLALTAPKTGAGIYKGDLYQNTGPALNADHFDPSVVASTKVGTATLVFTDRENGSFSYEVWPPGRISYQPIARTVPITREMFGPPPSCRSIAIPALPLATNFQDLWWAAPGSSESGWGINFSHQGDTIFGTWYTYDLDGAPLWLAVTANTMPDGSFVGDLYRTRGPSLGAASFDPHDVTASKVGSARLAFANGNDGSISYTVQLDGMTGPLSRTKSLTRFVYTGVSGTACR